MSRATVIVIVYAFVALAGGRAAAQTCVPSRLCLASVTTLGMDSAERAALTPALAGALYAPPCEPPIVVEEGCFGDDACLMSSGGGFITVRAVRAGAELRLMWAAVGEAAGQKTVRRGEHVTDVNTFLRTPTPLDNDVAAGPCLPVPGSPPDAGLPSPAAETSAVPVTDAAVDLPAPNGGVAEAEAAAEEGIPLGVAVGGIASAALVLASGITTIVASAIVQDPSAAGSDKETAIAVGTAGLVGIGVGLVAGATTGVLYLSTSLEPER